MTAAHEPKTCPSALCREGAQLLGVVSADATIAYVSPPTRIDADFVAAAEALGRPERRFRFADTCHEGGCPQWTGSGCGVIDHVIDDEDAGPVAAPVELLPRCTIRRTCRWYHQRGGAACHVCPSVIADTGGTATYASTRSTSSGQEPTTVQLPY